MGDLKEFMLIFRVSQAEYSTTKENDAALDREWKKFIALIAAQVKLVHTSSLSKKGAVIREQFVENEPSSEDGLYISGYLTMKSETIEDVMMIAKRCPILLIGGTVEVRETILIK